MGKGSGLIFRSFVDAARLLDKDSQLDAFNAYFDYMLDGVEYSGENAIVKALMLMATPSIDSAQARNEASCENGKKGGRPKTKRNLTKTQKNPDETQNYQTETEQEPNPNLNEDVDVYVDEDVDVNEDVDEDDIQNAPACARVVPTDAIAEIKNRVVEEGDLTSLARDTWIVPTKIVQDKDNIYICAPERHIRFVRDRYGALFRDAVKAINPEFSGEVVFAAG